VTLTPANARLRAHSGFVNSDDPLVSFLYILLRDHLPAGVVEGIMQNHVEVEEKDSEFCNGFIASYASELAQRIHPKQTLRVKVAAGAPPEELQALLTHINEGLVDPDYHIVLNYPVEIRVTTEPWEKP
jgi:hypothetical protein